MGELTPIIEGFVKVRDGKKWKNRYASLNKLSPVADILTLQLWKDKKDWIRNPPSKGSIALEEYIGWEAGFTLDKESLTLAVILKENILIFAFDSRETLMKWQMRITNQFEEGRQYSAHLLSSKSKITVNGLIRIHVQNSRFSMTAGNPLKLIHSWNLIDLRRFGALEEARFVFEGGSRCGKGEGIHILRLDSPEDLQEAFESASKGKLESKRKMMASQHGMSLSPSYGSNLCECSDKESSSHLDDSSFRYSRDDLFSRFQNNSNWSSTEGSNSCETMSIALSDNTLESSRSSDDHLINRRALLEKMGVLDKAPLDTSRKKSDFNPQWSMSERQRFAPMGCSSSFSMDRLSLSSHESFSSSGAGSESFVNYDTPKSLYLGSSMDSPPLTPKFSAVSSVNHQTPKLIYDNYDIPRSLKSTKEQDSGKHYGNYDIPKSCCSNIPRVRLTGNGKMPVVDFRSRSLLLQNENKNVPLYAVVNKEAKNKSHNYVNMEVRNYENTGSLISQINSNYVEMGPSPMYETLQQLPLIPFTNLSGDNYDTINYKLRKFHDSLQLPNSGKKVSSYKINYDDEDNRSYSEFKNISKSSDNLLDCHNYTIIDEGNTKTMPRSGALPEESVLMRRSFSVPCKRLVGERGSTSSSDSGFSTESPGGKQLTSSSVEVVVEKT